MVCIISWICRHELQELGVFCCEMLCLLTWLHVAAAGYMIAAEAVADGSATELKEIVEVLNVFDLRQLVCSAQLKVSISFRCVSALRTCEGGFCDICVN